MHRDITSNFTHEITAPHKIKGSV